MKTFYCEFCGKEFKLKWQLIIHISEHPEAKGDYVQLPVHLKNLKQRLEAHLQLKKFICPICGDEFSDELFLQQHILKHNDQMIVVQSSSNNNEDVNMIALESDPDVDPLLIVNEIPPVVKEEIPDLTLSKETPSMFRDFIGNEFSAKTENNADNEVFQKCTCDSDDIEDDIVKEEEFIDY